MDQIIDQVIGEKYRITKLIKRGFHSSVYAAHDILSNQPMAVKYYANIHLRKESEIKQIEDEAELLQSLQHNNIVHCTGFFRDVKTYFLVLEYIDGITLNEYISKFFNRKFEIEKCINIAQIFEKVKCLKDTPNIRYQYQNIIRNELKYKIDKNQYYQNKQLSNRNSMEKLIQYADVGELSISESNVLQNINNSTPDGCSNKPDKNYIAYFQQVNLIFLQLLNVLIYLEERQIMHRDISPDNIIIMPNQQIKLIDFGKCQQEQECSTITGTKGYIAPEMFTQSTVERKYSNKVDVWSAGVLLFQMLCGYQPFLQTKSITFMMFQALQGLYLPFDLFSDFPVSEKYVEAIESALTVDPRQRATAQKLREIIDSNIQPMSTKQSSLCEVKQIKVVLVGEFGIGKSTLLKRMAISNLSQQVQILHRSIMVDDEEIMLNFYDTLGGEADSGQIMPQIICNVNLCFLTYNVRDIETQSLQLWRQLIFSHSPNITQFYLGIDKCGSGIYRRIREGQDGLRSIIIDSNANVDEILSQAVRECVQSKCYYYHNFEQQEQLKNDQQIDKVVEKLNNLPLQKQENAQKIKKRGCC